MTYDLWQTHMTARGLLNMVQALDLPLVEHITGFANLNGGEVCCILGGRCVVRFPAAPIEAILLRNVRMGLQSYLVMPVGAFAFEDMSVLSELEIADPTTMLRALHPKPRGGHFVEDEHEPSILSGSIFDD